MFRVKNTICGETIAPACEYCEHGRLSSDHIRILCPKKGLVSPTYSCRRYLYDPLRRSPRLQPKLPDFTAEDFSLD